MIKKIVIIGPESTGKSTLCENLSRHFNTIWVKEYARQYLLENGADYTFENLYSIAQGQLNLEEEGIQQLTKNPSDTPIPLFIDTDMHVMKVWSEFVFGKCDNRILTTIATHKYDLYLLCDIDLPWVKDELREYPDLQTREKLFHHYKEAMIAQHIPWKIISGNNEERLINAIRAVESIF